jgi:Tol biopolymer transport system component
MSNIHVIRRAWNGRRMLLFTALCLALNIVVPLHAFATFPGKDGRIAFQGLDDSLGRSELFTMRADGTHRHQLTAFAHADIELPAWSPDGSRIAFDSDVHGNVHVFTIKADGSGLAQVTSGDGFEFSPTWSRDGRTMLLEHVEDGSPDGLFLYDLASTSMTRLTSNPFGQFDTRPRYSPDGTRVTFTRLKRFLPDGGALSAVLVMNADGSGLRRLTGYGENAAESDWSPDGRSIVFNDSDDRIQAAEIFSIRPDGTHRRQLTRGRDSSSFRPVWSPSGRRIMFTRARFGPGDAVTFHLFTMDAHGHRLARVRGSTTLENEADWGPQPGERTHEAPSNH